MSEGTQTATVEYSKESVRTKLAKYVQQALVTPAKPAEPFDLSCPAAANPAVARCSQAYTTAHSSAAKQGENKWDSERAAKIAYRNAMPPLSGPKNIRDFIACVAHAMLIDAINGSDAARLLYAAQIASAAHSSLLRKKNKSSTKTAPKPPENEHISHPISSLTPA
ncbi:hypothetical protein [Acidicapsa acidisoli]|uniref:hypothetical protein n=1 Tax=Acidicapsa acidisoli TaxID=1615681 RepID=UPI0021E0616C|nr:hypothetical protein [Acidicapsa acidisoli]